MKRLRLGAPAILLIIGMLALTGCSQSALALDAHGTSAGKRPVVVAIGDSIMKGNGLPAAQAWPALLAKSNNWDLTNLACDGAGFLAVGDDNECGADFSGVVGEAVELHPDVILISGSSNDLGLDNSRLTTETAAVITDLRAKLPSTTILGISTVWNDTAAPSQLEDINQQVQTAVLAARGTYLNIGRPLAGHRSWLQSDDVHPTARGQQELAKAIAAAIRSAKLSI